MKSFDYKQALLYDEYFIIDSEAYHEKIRYYDKYRIDILDLPFEQSSRIRLDHACALFKVGAYQQYLQKAESLIRLVIQENIFEFNGKDIFEDLLYMKAQSLYCLLHYEEAKAVAGSLMHIKPDAGEYAKLYYKIKVDAQRLDAQKLRGLSIVLFILSAIVIAVELLLVRSFYVQHIETVEWIRNGLFISGLAILAYIEVSIRLKAKSTITKINDGLHKKT